MIKKFIHFTLFILSFVIGIPLTTYAQDVSTLGTGRVLITELQTESIDSANLEFLEIYNPGSVALDMDGWVIQYRAATGTSWLDKAVLNGFIYKQGSVVISTQNYNVENSSFFWTNTDGQLASTGGNIRILAVGESIAEDTLAWGNGIFGEASTATKPPKGQTLHRKKVDTAYQDTNDNSADFYIDNSDPVNQNLAPADVEEDEPVSDTTPDVLPDSDTETEVINEDSSSNQNQNPPVDDSSDNNPTSESTDEEIPLQNTLLPMMITELMVNPASPELDSSDEWIELFNPNDVAFDLSGYKLQSGSSYNYTYVFSNTMIQPFGYWSITSGDSNLALTNTSGAVRILDSSGATHGESVAYTDVEEGNTYALSSGGQWQWTTTPTKSATNVFTEAPIVVKQSTATAKKSSTAKASTKATAKTTTVKASTAKASTTKAPKSAEKPSPVSTLIADAPIEPKTRPLLLASFGVIAVLYGIYEYKDDLSNALWRFRKYAQLRRKNRQSV